MPFSHEQLLDSGSWQMYGEFKKGQSVLVLEYTQSWGDHIKLLFLSYHNGEAVLLDKRKGQGRKWFLETKKGGCSPRCFLPISSVCRFCVTFTVTDAAPVASVTVYSF